MIQANSTQGSGNQRTQCGLARQHLWLQLPKSEKQVQGISHSSALPPGHPQHCSRKWGSETPVIYINKCWPWGSPNQALPGPQR